MKSYVEINKEIANNLNIHPNLVRDILKELRELAKKELQSGRKFKIYGMCIMIPTIKEKVEYIPGEGMKVKKYLSYVVKASKSLKSEIEREGILPGDFEVELDSDEEALDI